MRPIYALVPLLLVACVTPAATQDAAGGNLTVDVRHEMQAEVNPAIVAIWEVGNEASDENGGLDGARMTPATWDQLALAAARLAESSERMAAATEIRAASAGNMATEDYEVSMTTVQTYLDADPDGFRALSREFAQLSRTLETAARARDAATAGDLVARMDVECSVCHARFWYAEAE